MDRELLVAVEALASRRCRCFGFPGWLERRFEADTGTRYAQIQYGDVWRSALFYNLFRVGPFLLTRDAVRLAVALHFFVVTPLKLLVARLIQARLKSLALDIAAASVPVLIACQIL